MFHRTLLRHRWHLWVEGRDTGAAMKDDRAVSELLHEIGRQLPGRVAVIAPAPLSQVVRQPGE